MLTAACAALLQPWPLKLVLDCVVGGHQPPIIVSHSSRFLSSYISFGVQPKLPLLFVLCMAILLLQLLIGAINVVSTYVIIRVGLNMVFKLRCTLFDHLQRLSLSFHDETSVGDSLYRVAWDTYCIQTLFNGGIVPAVTAVISLVGITGIMLWLDWLVTLAALSLSIPLVLLIKRLDRPMTERSLRVHERESDISTRVQETLTGIRAVQAFGREDFESVRFRQHAQASLKANLVLTVLQVGSQAAIALLLAAGTALVIWLSVTRALQGRLTNGDVVLLAAYVAMLYKPLETLAYTAATVQGAAAGARRVYALLDAAPGVVDAPDAVELSRRANGHITFDGVSFGYHNRQRVLRDINLNIPAGSTLALVGASGAGKTTLVSLLLRFYDPEQGRISLDGADLRGIALQSLRRNMALVSQEPVLFSASIHENIAYAWPDATADQIKAAARAANAHDFIEALPEGYETQIGERGVGLSGGQRQRLSIARAFLKDAPVLIMDEPTSALDLESEALILQSLTDLMRDRTTIIIAHRLSTIRNADTIVVLGNGEILEKGRHEELLGRDGAFKRLYNRQFSGNVASKILPAEIVADMT